MAAISFCRRPGAWSSGRERERMLGHCREIVLKLAAVPAELATVRLNRSRLKWEMDFFLKHFFPCYPVRGCGEAELGAMLKKLVDAIEPECVFAHRDFHSRNLLVLGQEIVMVDFQDSLLAPRYYDLVSLAFDSYLDLGRAREILFSGRRVAAVRTPPAAPDRPAAQHQGPGHVCLSNP